VIDLPFVQNESVVAADHVMKKYARWVGVCAILLRPASPASAATVEIRPGGDLRAAIASLTPGDELVLRGGTYSFNSRFAMTAVGTPTQPITIRGAQGETALIEMETPSENVVDIENSRYLVVSNLHFRGGSHGIRLISSSFVTIRDSEVYETGDVGISANAGGTYEGLLIRHNHIHNTSGSGEGMYLGCNDNACRVLNSVIEWNYVHDTNGPAVEQGDGIELKEGSAGNTIRDNVIHDTNYPGIITYSTAGNGPANIIEGNAIWNTKDYAIQSAADSIIRNNIVLGTIGLQAHQAGRPSNQIVVHNTILSNDDGIDVRNVSGSVVIANNAIYSLNGTAIHLISGKTELVTVAGNIGAGGLSGASGGFTSGNGTGLDLVSANFSGGPPLDLFPKAGSALIAAAVARYVTDFDFNGTARNGARDVGAFRYDAGGNPGWKLAASFKSAMASVAPNSLTAVTSH
jgi:parallel beta-helix repeat protein